VIDLPACEGYDVPAGAYVLVRSDGYIGAISQSAEVIEKYLRR